MSTADALAVSPALQLLGWSLLHALWQGTLLAALAALPLRASRALPASFRYRLACGALAAMVLLPALTGWRMQRVWVEHERCWAVYESGALPSRTCLSHGIEAALHRAHGEPLPPVEGPGAVREASVSATGALAVAGAAWALGAFLALLRTAGGYLRAHRLRRTGSPPDAGTLAGPSPALLESLGIRRPVLLLCSSAVDVPTVVGWRHPAILLPPEALVRLRPDELEAVLAHELAHVARADFAANLLHAVADALLLFHPAARWLSRRIRGERELCCDEMAVGAARVPLPVYLRALLAVDALRRPGAPTVGLAMSGAALLPRARRLAAAGTRRGGRVSRRLLLLLAAASLWAVALRAPAAADLGSWAVMTVDLRGRADAAP